MGNKSRAVLLLLFFVMFVGFQNCSVSSLKTVSSPNTSTINSGIQDVSHSTHSSDNISAVVSGDVMSIASPKLEDLGTYGLVYYYLGGNKGLVLCFHGTGGSASGWSTAGKETYLKNLAQAGYSFVCPTSVNRTTKQWSSESVNNIDVLNVEQILTFLKINYEQPVFLVGHSNGGGFVSRFSVFTSRKSQLKAVQFSNSSGIKQILQNNAYIFPTLYSYSNCDQLVLSSDVESNIRLLGGRGIAVLDGYYSLSGATPSLCHEFVDNSRDAINFFSRY